MKGVPVAVGIASVPTHGKGKQRAYDDVEEDQQMEEVSYEDKDVTLVLDPTRNEEQNASARFCFGWAFGSEFSSGRRTGRQRGEQENQDEDAECIYVESDGEFDTVTVSPRRDRRRARWTTCLSLATIVSKSLQRIPVRMSGFDADIAGANG
jgi:hypothetical protein